MDKAELLEILNDWNFWKKELDVGIEREAYLERCLRILEKINVVAAIVGVRRAGKSYVMRQVMKRLAEKGTAKNDILFVNFEDRRFSEFYPKLLDEIYETYLEFLKPGKKPFVFLDEVHNVPKWERWVRTMHELGRAKIMVSGSSSKLLAGELATVMTGRHLDVFVFPLDFGEFLRFNNVVIKDSLDSADRKIELKRLFREYQEYGGFPEVVLAGQKDEKRQLLLTHFDDVLTKDIERRYRLRRSEKLRALARFYLTNMAGTITFSSIAKFLETTTNTVEKFSSYLLEANLVFFVKRFSFKVKEQEKAPRKVYSIDTGMANAVGFRFMSNFGRAAENTVAIGLKRRHAADPLVEPYYWTDGRGEVDFAVKRGDEVESLIQVCWDPTQYGTKEREVNSLLKAGRELKCGRLFVITGETYEGEETIKGEKIRFVPLWKWMLLERQIGK